MDDSNMAETETNTSAVETAGLQGASKHQSAPMRRGSITDTDEDWAYAEDTLYVWHRRARNALFAHQQAANHNSVVNVALGVGLLIVTALVQVFKMNATASIVLGTVATALVALQTLLKEAERAARHLSSANTYSSIRRHIEAINGMPRTHREPITKVLTDVAKLIDDAAKTGPSVTDRVWDAGVKKADHQRAEPIFPNRNSATSRS